MDNDCIKQALSSTALISAVKTEMDVIADEFGATSSRRHSYLSISVDGGSVRVSASLDPEGVSRGTSLYCTGATLAEAMRGLREKARLIQADAEREAIRNMAILIMRSHADHGECRPEHLRVDFDQRAIDRLGARACAEAERIAGSGPFTISSGVGLPNAPAEA